MTPRISCMVALTLVLSGCVPVMTPPATSLHTSFFRDQRIYDRMYRDAGAVDAIGESIVGSIVPHHLLVGREFARFYQSLRTQDPDVVVVIGPNHFDVGSAPILTTTTGYLTPYGDLPIDEPIVSRLLASGFISLDDAPFIREHSIAAEVAFIRQTFPHARLVPIILKERVTRTNAVELGRLLAHILPAKSLVLASVDFSHYLPENVADFHDATSRSAIANVDRERIWNLEIDSPASIAALLTYLHERGAERIVEERHTNSASFSGEPGAAETTSHFFIAFGRGTPAATLGMSVLAFGDTIFDRRIRQIIARDGASAVFDRLRGKEGRFLRGTDIQMLNVEGPFVPDGEVPHANRSGVIFKNDRRGLAVLRSHHFSVVHTANNHRLDAGEAGAMRSAEMLTAAGITPLGWPKPCTQRIISGHRLALCGFDDSRHDLDLSTAAGIIAAAARESDRVLVSVHWGTEEAPTPNARQRMLARAFVKAGADAIIGHGSHVIQPMERVDGIPVFYSLGNFVFDDDRKLGSLRGRGLGVGLFFAEERTDIWLFPIATVGGQPAFLPWAERQSLIAGSGWVLHSPHGQ